MTATLEPTKPVDLTLPATVPVTEPEAAHVMRCVISYQTALETLVADREAKINEVKAAYAERCMDLTASIMIGEEMMETYATLHPGLFEDSATVKLEGHVIGWSPGKWKVVCEDNVTEDQAVEALEAMIAKGESVNATPKAVARGMIAGFLLRTTRELDKKRCLEESKKPEVLKILGEVGLYLTKEDKFFMRPDRAAQPTPTRRSKAKA